MQRVQGLLGVQIWGKATKGIKFKGDLEGEKVEDKTIRVICTDKESTNLTFGKEYEALKKWEEKQSKMKPYGAYWCYLIVDDTENKSVEPCCLFKEVEDVLMVECINNGIKLALILNKKYPVIKKENVEMLGECYWIKNEDGLEQPYCVNRFKPVQDKENRCYNEKCVDNNKNGICNNVTFMKVCEMRDTKQPTPINYEEEYNKLKKENDKELNHYNKVSLSQEKRLESAYNERTQIIKERDNYKEIAESQNKRIEELENINKDINNTRELIHEEMVRLANENTELKAQLENELGRNRILNERLEEEREDEDKIYSEVSKDRDRLLNENKELKKQNNQGYMEQMNITINEKNEDELNQLRCQYEEAKQTIDSLMLVNDKYMKKQKSIESDLIKYESTIKNQKEAIKSLASLL